MSHLIQDRSHLDGNRHHDWRGGTQQVRAHNPFFVKPYIHFDVMHHEPVNNITFTAFGENPMVFSGNVWIINIQNKKRGKLSRNASNCRVEISRFKRDVDVADSVRLPWKSDPLPNSCNYPSSFQSIDEYRAKLPFCYIGRLIHDISNPTILVGGANDIVLACTFSELHSLYIVSQKTIGEDDVISIPFNELDNYEFLIKFYSNQVTHEKRFRLNTSSWNDVKLTWV
jgi:hypothetical protein